jgi:hypothetical protein
MNDSQMPWLFQGGMPAALWANWCLMFLQMMACVSLAAGSCTRSMEAARTCYESFSAGILLPKGR